MRGSGRPIYSRRPVHGGHDARAVQGARGLAIGAVEVWLWCGDGREQEGLRGGELRELKVGDGHVRAWAAHGVLWHGRVVSGATGFHDQGARCGAGRGRAWR